MQSKGAAIALVSVILSAFISSGAIFSGLMTTNQVRATTNYSTEHVNVLMEAQTKRNIYEDNLRNELKYAHNNKAFREGNIHWENEIPSQEELEERFKQKILTGDYGLKTQNRMFSCEEPSITAEDLKINSDNAVNLEMTEKYIKCRGKDSKAILPVETQNIRSNSKNNYLKILKYFKRLSENTEQEIEDAGTVRAQDETGCEESSEIDREEARESFIEEAKIRSVEGQENLADKIYEETSGSRESFINKKDSETRIIGSSNIELSSESCGEGKTRYNGDIEFNPERITVNYTLSDGENKVTTFKGEKRLENYYVYSSNLE